MQQTHIMSSLKKPVNFIKVILSDDTRSTGISLPEKFTKQYGKYLSERVTLKVPNGDVWQVDLQKSGNEIWLKNGWRKFAERYVLGYSNLLMFKYEGSSTFGVIIFNASASEIKYPDQRRISVKQEAGDEDDDDDESSSCSEDQEDGIILITDEGECSSKKQREKGIRGVENAKADFKCEEPFMVYINESHLTNRGVFIPVGIRRKLLKGDKNCKYLLQLKNDGKFKAWNVFEQNGYLGNADWMMFVEYNGVKVGDICVLEPIDKDKSVLGVTIYRSSS